jgi:hypothetical protein
MKSVPQRGSVSLRCNRGSVDVSGATRYRVVVLTGDRAIEHTQSPFNPELSPFLLSR